MRGRGGWRLSTRLGGGGVEGVEGERLYAKKYHTDSPHESQKINLYPDCPPE
jgi:hypothetical protein